MKRHIKNTVDLFEEVVRLDETAYGIVQERDIRKMVCWLPSGSDVLDAGCGFGLPTAQAADFFNVSACDIPGYANRDNRFHEAVMQERGIDFKWSEPGHLPYADGSFDGVLLYAVIEHVPDKVEFLTECRRVLRPGGRIFMFRAVNRIAVAERMARVLGLCTHGDDVVDRGQMQDVFEKSGLRLDTWGYQGWLPENRMPKYAVYVLNQILVRLPWVRKFSHDFFFICTRSADSPDSTTG